ncbi:MAG: hypothetical protein A3D89_03575 [Planctomycetes bacterium RIFCSPHIGHO2_02_FULL_52_58]|nr:MAG: hypothetical protein A3D89_03575 [Planctomycetes bacterium RIFCSPHIGHO2_02_FULL_52_58]
MVFSVLDLCESSNQNPLPLDGGGKGGGEHTPFSPLSPLLRGGRGCVRGDIKLNHPPPCTNQVQGFVLHPCGAGPSPFPQGRGKLKPIQTF